MDVTYLNHAEESQIHTYQKSSQRIYRIVHTAEQHPRLNRGMEEDRRNILSGVSIMAVQLRLNAQGRLCRKH